MKTPSTWCKPWGGAFIFFVLKEIFSIATNYRKITEMLRGGY